MPERGPAHRVRSDPSASTRRHTIPAATRALRLALGLDGLAVAALVAYVVVTGGGGRDDDVGFLGDPLPDGLAVLAFAAALAAGVVAAWALVREPPRTRATRGLLLVPLLIGAGALMFILGD